MKYIASWSGGKDSTYMVDELLKRGLPLDEVIFCDTGYEFEIMYTYILNVEKYWKNKYPDIKITKLNWGKGKEIWDSLALSEFSKGEHVGKVRGFPFAIGMSWCTNYMKVKPYDKYIKSEYKDKGYDVTKYIGIAYDEPDRVRDTGEVYPLVEWGLTERDVAEQLIERGLHNPLYNVFSRTGCFMCPKQSLANLYKVWKYYPHEWCELIKMQKRYIELGAGVSSWKFYEDIEKDIIPKFIKYERNKSKKIATYFTEEHQIGCMCK